MKKEYSALNGEKIQCDYVEIDFLGGDAVDLLARYTDGEFIYARKTREVVAQPVKEGQVVETKPLATISGQTCIISETTQVVTDEHVARGDMLVTNPDGEQYIVKGPKFQKIYTQVSDGVYKPQGETKAFLTTTTNICFKASWGEVQFAPKGSKLCVSDLGDIYSVTDSAFDATYEIENQPQENENQ